MKRSKRGLGWLLALLITVGGTLVFLRSAPTASALFRRPDPQEMLGPADTVQPLTDSVGTFPVPAPTGTAGTVDGQALLDAFLSSRSYQLLGPCVTEGKKAEQSLRISLLDPALLGEGLNAELAALLRERVEAAEKAEEIYENGTFRAELLQEVFHAALAARLQTPENYLRVHDLSLSLSYSSGMWQLNNAQELADAALGSFGQAARADELAASLYDAATADLPYMPLHYRIEENALAGPTPNPDCFGVTDDPAVITELLQRPEAQALIGGQELVWNAELELFPDSPIRYYLDDSLLVLVWQEVEARGVGTFSEVFIQDGSQFRRLITSEHWEEWKTTTDFAQATNAVLASGADYFFLGRNCGIGVYQRELFHYVPTCDICYVTADGDMLFSYVATAPSEEEARRFVADNDVVFSLCFGPVLIDDGVDVTPDFYPWGEVNEEYARSAIGMLGRHHYLKMDINCGTGVYYYLATLRQAADAMVKRGCIKAYALDGGQTATTVFNGELINPVQFGWEKQISDIIYFATAVPNP